jgi:FMN reductase
MATREEDYVNLVVLVGNPKPRSRTLVVAELLADRVAKVTSASHDLTVDLCNHADSLFRWPDDELAQLSADVAAADIVIVASPTYKASYTGLLKAFLDRYPGGGLTGVTAIPLMTVADPAHSLSVEFTLRPLLVELGASLPTKGMSFLTPAMADAPALVEAWVHDQEHVLMNLSAENSRDPGGSR